MINLNWANKTAWYGLTALLLALGVTWMALSRVPAEAAAARSQRSPSPQIGFAAPDFTLKTLDGQTITLSKLRGQPVVINFWASWCPPCRAEMPAIQQVYERYRGQGFTVLAVDMQESETQVTTFAGQMGLTFPILIDEDGTVAARYRVNALPSTYFVDRQGVIRNITLGGPMAEAFIESEVANLLPGNGGK